MRIDLKKTSNFSHAKPVFDVFKNGYSTRLKVHYRKGKRFSTAVISSDGADIKKVKINHKFGWKAVTGELKKYL